MDRKPRSNVLLENANKFAFLVKQYPQHNLDGLVALLVQMPSINTNTAIWRAVELGYVKTPDKKTKFVEFVKEPEDGWILGDIVRSIQDLIVYGLQQLAKEERDLEENYISRWTMGYPGHDVIIALADMVNRGEITTYTIDDKTQKGEVNTYTFYTLPENKDAMWGQKEFKKNPLKTETPEKEAETTTAETTQL